MVLSEQYLESSPCLLKLVPRLLIPLSLSWTVPRVMPVDSPAIPEVTQAPPRMASLKDAQAAVEEGGSTIWGQLPDLPFKFDKTGLGFTIKGQKMIRRERAGQLPFRISQNGVHAIEDDDNDFDI